MAFEESKGLIAIATGYANGSYQYEAVDLNYVQMDTIIATPSQMQDLDSYVNGKGYLKRTVLEHSRSKWEANTTILTSTQVQKLLKLLQKGFTLNDSKCSKAKRELRLRYYNEWENDHVAGYFYVPDITFTYKIMLNGKLYYQPIRFAFIEK